MDSITKIAAMVPKMTMNTLVEREVRGYLPGDLQKVLLQVSVLQETGVKLQLAQR